MASLRIVSVAALFASAFGSMIQSSPLNSSQEHAVLTALATSQEVARPWNQCGQKSLLRIKPGAAALLQDKNVPGAGITHFAPFATVLKDGFSTVTCIKDQMYYEGDKFGDNKHDYKLGAAGGVSIVHYENFVAKEDQEEMTQKVCFKFCRTVPNMGFFGIVNGRGCYCTPYFVAMASDSSQCDSVCEGEKTLMCGGKSKSSIFSMHMCADTKEDLDKAVEKASALKASIAAGSETATKTSETLQDAGTRIQGAFGTVGDSGASGIGQSMKQFAGTLAHAAEDGKKWDNKFDGYIADAAELIKPPATTTTTTEITLVNTTENNGAAYCSAYCAYNWNSEMPSHFEGACCLNAYNAVTGAKMDCTQQTPVPAPPPPPQVLIKETASNNGDAYCSAYCAANWNSEMPSNWKGACCLKAVAVDTGEEIACNAYNSGQGTTCTCQQQDSTPWVGENPSNTDYTCPEAVLHQTVSNNGDAYCSAYCGYNWNNELPSSWKGACCLKAVAVDTGEEIACTAYNSGKGTTCTCQNSASTPWLTGGENSGNENNVCSGPVPQPPTPAPPPPPPAPVPRAGLTCECQIQNTSPFLTGSQDPDNEDYVCAGPIPPPPTPSPAQPRHFSDPHIVSQAEEIMAKIKEDVPIGEEDEEELQKLNAESKPKSSDGAAAQYYPVMYFVNKKYEDVPSTCAGDMVGTPMVGDQDACAGACDAHIHDCVGYQFFDLGKGKSTCTMLSNFKTGFYYTGCGDAKKSFLQTISGKKAAPFAATCYAKLSKFEGTTLKPNPSGKCKQCFKELTKADRCY